MRRFAPWMLAFVAAASLWAADPPAGKEAAQSAGTSDDASKHHHIRLGGIMIGAGYSHFSGYPGYYGYPYGYAGGFSPGYYGGFYPAFDPFFFGFPFYPGYWYGYGPQTSRGEVKLRSAPKNAAVFLNGAYAGSADKLKTMWLDPGAYSLELRSGGQVAYQQRIYVLSGKKLKIDTAQGEERP